MRVNRQPRKIDLSGRTPIGHGAEPARWPGLADDLMRQIETGGLKPGAAVTIGWKRREWKCSLGTAERAFDHLCRRGYLLRPRARGDNYRVADGDSWMR